MLLTNNNLHKWHVALYSSWEDHKISPEEKKKNQKTIVFIDWFLPNVNALMKISLWLRMSMQS